MSRRYLVAPTAASALPGDVARAIDLEMVDLHRVRAATASVGGIGAASQAGAVVVEVVVDGWRFELGVEHEARAALRRRATRAQGAATTSGPTEIRAIIPGRVATIRVAVGDVVEAGQGLLVVEAMKMQNELRAARAGTVERVAVEPGQTIDNGDLLVVVR